MPGFRERTAIEGLEPLVARLNDLKSGKRTPILKRATAKGSKVVLKADQDNLKGHGFKTSDLLYKAQGAKVAATKKGGVYAVVGPRTGFQRTKAGTVVTKLGARYAAAKVNPVRYAHLVEKGRKAVAPVKARVLLMIDAEGNARFARRAKAVAKRPFLKPALERNRDRVREVMAEEIGRGLTRLAKAGVA